jgi:hypothetical protein
MIEAASVEAVSVEAARVERAVTLESLEPRTAMQLSAQPRMPLDVAARAPRVAAARSAARVGVAERRRGQHDRNRSERDR